MSAGLTVRSTGSAAQASHARPDATLTRPAALTDLPPEQAVTAASGATGARYDTTRTPSSDPHGWDIVLDLQSREVIDRSINAGSRRIVRQSSEAAARRLKAYTRSASKDAAPHDP